MTVYKKAYSEGLLKRTCCVCGNYWPHSGACLKCKEELNQKELVTKEETILPVIRISNQ